MSSASGDENCSEPAPTRCAPERRLPQLESSQTRPRALRGPGHSQLRSQHRLLPTAMPAPKEINIMNARHTTIAFVLLSDVRNEPTLQRPSAFLPVPLLRPQTSRSLASTFTLAPAHPAGTQPREVSSVSTQPRSRAFKPGAGAEGRSAPEHLPPSQSPGSGR